MEKKKVLNNDITPDHCGNLIDFKLIIKVKKKSNLKT